MADVFISYHENSAGELAQQIADALNRAGISSWCARRDLPPGSNFAMNIPTQIHNCRLFLLILNESAYQSSHVANEVGIAFSRLNKGENITILPIEIGDFTRESWIEYYLIHTQSVKISPSDPQRVEKLIREIARILGVTPRQPQTVPPPQAKPVQPPRITQPSPQSWRPQPAQLSPQPAQPSANIILSGQCGDNVHYTLDNQGVLTISGYGPMWNYSYIAQKDTVTTPWYLKRNAIFEVRIQNGVTSIATLAFCRCNRIVDVTISNSVHSIARGAFLSCYNLNNIFIPDGVTFIEYGSFNDCNRLRSVSVPAKATIAKDAFPATTQIIRRP